MVRPWARSAEGKEKVKEKDKGRRNALREILHRSNERERRRAGQLTPDKIGYAKLSCSISTVSK